MGETAAGRSDPFLLDLLRRRRMVLTAVCVGGLVGAAVGFNVGPSYKAHASFRVEGESEPLIPAQLASLAGQFGVSLPGGSEQTVEYFAYVVQSWDVLKVLATARYPTCDVSVPNCPDSTSFVAYRGYDANNPKDIRDAVEDLGNRVQVESERDAGVVEITVEARYPRMAEGMARALIDAANTFNVEKRQSLASAQRRFLDARVAGAADDLKLAEDSQEQFLARNKTYLSSPQLVFDNARLQRRVDLAQGVYVTLTQAREQARIDEVKNTPLITVIEQPEGTAEARVVYGIWIPVGCFMGLGLALLWLAARRAITEAVQSGPGTYDEVARELSAMRLSVRQWLRWHR